MHVEGELDLPTAGKLSEVALAVTETGRTSRLVIDLGGVSFCDSSGLGALVAAQKACTKQGIRMLLRRPNDQICRLLTLTGLADFFTVDPAE